MALLDDQTKAVPPVTAGQRQTISLEGMKAEAKASDGDEYPKAIFSRGRSETQRIEHHVSQRYVLLNSALERWDVAVGTWYGDEDRKHARPIPELIFDLCALDVFVEKAQDRLTERARSSNWTAFGQLVLIAFIFFLAIAYLYFVYFHNQPSFFQLLLHRHENAWIDFAANMLRNITVIGLLLGAIYLLTMLVRANYHEATILLNRRHSLRLGRLYLYLRLTAAKSATELSAIKTSLTPGDFERIFGWNLETSTAFKDIRGEAVTSTLFGQILTTIQKGLESVKRG
jgi:hypothetical protein